MGGQRLLGGVFAVFALSLVAFSADARPMGNGGSGNGNPNLGEDCALGDVTIDNDGALACAGVFAANTDINSLTDWKIRDDSLADGEPAVDGWLFGLKLDLEDDGDVYTLGLLDAGALESLGAGKFEIDVSPYEEFVIGLKQATGYAFYYFNNSGGDGAYALNWWSNDPTAMSHITVWVRTAAVPAPGMLSLLGGGLILVGLMRRRASLR